MVIIKQINLKTLFLRQDNNLILQTKYWGLSLEKTFSIELNYDDTRYW